MLVYLDIISDGMHSGMFLAIVDSRLSILKLKVKRKKYASVEASRVNSAVSSVHEVAAR
jgi:hypothetical protein